MPSWSSWNCHHSHLSTTRVSTHLLSYLWSRVGREPLCLDLCLPFDLSSTWRGVSQVTCFPPFSPKSGQTLNERYTPLILEAELYLYFTTDGGLAERYPPRLLDWQRRLHAIL